MGIDLAFWWVLVVSGVDPNSGREIELMAWDFRFADRWQCAEEAESLHERLVARKDIAEPQVGCIQKGELRYLEEYGVLDY